MDPRIPALYLDTMRLAVAGGVEGLHTPLHALPEVDGRTRHRDLARGDPAHVDQIVDELGQILQLASDGDPRLLAGLVTPAHRLQDTERGADDAEGVAELVCQHRDELILSHVAILDLPIEQTV